MSDSFFFRNRFRLVTSIIVPILSVMAVPAFGTASPKVAKEVLRIEEKTGENRIDPAAARPYGKGFEKEENRFRCDNGSATDELRGVSWWVRLDQEQPTTVVAEGWSRAEDVEGSPSADYSIYLDIAYVDGTHLWGQSIAFSTGTHDWQHKRLVVMPEKPIRSLTFYALFRNKSGKVQFRDMKLAVAPYDPSTTFFDGVPVRDAKASAPASPSLQIRDVAANSDFLYFDTETLGIRRNVETEEIGYSAAGRTFRGTATTVTLENVSEADRCLTFVYARKTDELRDIRFCNVGDPPSGPRPAGRESIGPSNQYQIGSSGRLSKFPFAAVVGITDEGSRGRAVGIDMARPGFFRNGYNHATGELFVAVDLALTKEAPRATLRFVDFPFDPSPGFRGAVDAYYRLFPDFFKVRVTDQGVWMPFYPISKVPGHEDFGFRIKEGNDEPDWDDEHGILTFRYTEPMTWWMSMPKERPTTYESALQLAKELAESGNTRARALFRSGMKTEDGLLAHLFQDTPWCVGVVWSSCDVPGIEGGGYSVNWNRSLADGLYGPPGAPKSGGVDGEYVDSSEGYVTAVLDFDRDHFSTVRYPLVFCRQTFRPAVFRGLVAYEYIRSMSEDVHARDKLMMANSTPHALCWLAPYLDVLGTETNWNHGDTWQPTMHDELLFRRVLCGAKPYCFLMNTDFSKWSYEMTEKFMKRSIFYGMFPGFFSADASTGHYFSRPELFERDRPLFKKYIPICKEVAEAGWKPIRRAESSQETVRVERFGDDRDPKKAVFTVLNDSGETQTVEIRFDAAGFDAPFPRRWKNRIDGKEYELNSGSLTITLDPEDIAVLVP